MALPVSDIQAQVAYRLGESSAQLSTTTTGIQRLDWINRGYFDIARRQNWWWEEKTDTSNVNIGAASYTVPADLKEFIQLKIGNIYYDRIPYYQNRIFRGTAVVVSLPQTIRSYKFYTLGNQYYLVPTDGNDGVTHYIDYYQRVTKRTQDSDTFLIPDEYLEALAAYAEGRYWMSITQQVKAQGPFQEYEQILQQMRAEHGRRGWGSPGYSIIDPDQSLG